MIKKHLTSCLQQTKRINYALALFLLVSLLLLLPAIFMLSSFNSSTQRLIIHHTGLVFSVCLITVTILNAFSYLYEKLQGADLAEIRLTRNLLSFIFGASLMLYLSAILAGVYSMLTAVLVWLISVATIAIGLYIFSVNANKKLPKQAKPISSTCKVDFNKLFDPRVSNAIHLIKVEHIGQGDKFGQYLLNEGLTIEVLDSSIDNSYLLKITEYEHTAYAKIENLSLYYLQQFFNNTKSNCTDLPEHQQWNISVAFLQDTRGMYFNITNTIDIMINDLPPEQKPESFVDIKVRPFQRSQNFVEYVELLHQVTNNKIKSLQYHQEHLEIITCHYYKESSTIIVERAATFWLADNGFIESNNNEINEDITVSTPNVALSALPLPYPECKLTDIKIFKPQSGVNNGNEHYTGGQLYLTFTQIINGEVTANEISKLIEFKNNRVAYGKDCNTTDHVTSVQEYISEHCIYRFI